MTKYDVELNLESENSLSLIISMIKPNSKILEFGPANGRLTKYLYKDLGCTIDIVEIDENSGIEASKFSRFSLIGKNEGNIEKYLWSEKLKDEKYDYIIFADVLEHLYDPKNVLKKTKEFLKPKGNILISIPNIAHNSVIIELLNNNFDYTDVGLLDNTHVRFFTYNSLIKMFNECGLKIADEKAVIWDVEEESIIDTSYSNISEILASELKKREFYDIYQFIFKLSIEEQDKTIKKLNGKRNVVTLYYSEKKGEFSETQKKEVFILGNGVEELKFDFENSTANYFRIDVSDSSIMFEIKSSYFYDRNGNRNKIKYDSGNYARKIDDVYMFFENDPKLYFEKKIEHFKEIVIEIKILDFIRGSTFKYDFLYKEILKLEKNVIQLSKILEDKEIALEQLEQLNVILNREKSVLFNLLSDESNKNIELISENVLLTSKKSELKSENIILNQQIKALYEESLMKIILRKIYHKLPLKQAHKEKIKNYIFRTTKKEKITDFTSFINEVYEKVGKKSENFVEISSENIKLTPEDVKIIAFYLPQFHPFPENDKWWGKGFTEWTNVSKGLPQFIGHYQPHFPGELGFYDLRIEDIQKRQVELAQKYGISGFCFHYYWFGGKRLMERPVEQFINNKELDFPFCICWANENWTRRWDGSENDILIAQNHSKEDDINFIKNLVELFNDERYIRINGKPVIIVYRVNILPEAEQIFERWRVYCRENGIGEIYIIGAQTFGFTDPNEYKLDAAVEFPPHTMPGIRYYDSVEMINRNFDGKIYDFNYFVEQKKYLEKTNYKLYKTSFPGWDNTARKPNNAHIFHGVNPENYYEWLLDNIKYTKTYNTKNEQYVFINAWNEWGEGAYLEPDKKYGYGYLEATKKAILNTRNK